MRHTTAVLLSGLVLLAGAALLTDSTARAADAKYRFIVPSNIQTQDIAPSTRQEFESARENDKVGIGITVEIDRSGSGYRKVPLTTPICEGDRVAFEFILSQDAHLLIVNKGTSGSTNRLYPPSGTSFVPAGTSVRFPPRGAGDLVVDEKPGTEGFLLYRSTAGLSTSMRGLFEELAPGATRGLEIATAAQEASPEARKVRVLNRDVNLGLSRDNTVYDVAQGENVLGFTLEHIAAPCPPLR